MMSSEEECCQPPVLIDDIFVNQPKSLKETCFNYIVDKPENILFSETNCENTKDECGKSLRQELPFVFGNEFLKSLLSRDVINSNVVLRAFSDPEKCRIHHCIARNVLVQYKSLSQLCGLQNVINLELYNVWIEKVPSATALLDLCKKNSVTFHLQWVAIEEISMPDRQSHQLSRCNYPHLKSVRLNGVTCAWYLVVDKQDPPALSHLDLSNHKEADPPLNDLHNVIRKVDGEEEISADTTSDYVNPLLRLYRLSSLRSTLVSLTLHNTYVGNFDLRVIFQLVKLQHLDISVQVGVRRQNNPDHSPDTTVPEITDRLPSLRSLDVGGTTIGDRLYTDADDVLVTGGKVWKKPVRNRLDFIGLCESEGCELDGIYKFAKQVAGYHDEAQILTAISSYMDRLPELTMSLNRLYGIHQRQMSNCPLRTVKLLIEAVRRYPNEEGLLTITTANFFFICRSHYTHLACSHKRGMIETILQIIRGDRRKNPIIRNCLMALFHFEVPKDFMYDFNRIASTILSTLSAYESEEITQLTMHLCNGMVCSTDYDVKRMMADVGLIPAVMAIIRRKFQGQVCDDLMSVSWGCLWNVTDETPANGREFIQLGGLELMLNCFEKFSGHLDLRNNAMGLMGNIAEVEHLRPHLMTKDLLDMFVKQIHIVTHDNMEVSYNACGTLSHLLSDGEKAWTVTEPARDYVRERLWKAIQSWPTNLNRQINYRSFRPILGLIGCGVMESTHWAIWAIHNLLHFDDRYSKILHREQGADIVSRVLSMDYAHDITKQLSREILKALSMHPTTAGSGDSLDDTFAPPRSRYDDSSDSN